MMWQMVSIVQLSLLHLEIVILVCRNRAVRLLQCFKFPYFPVLPVCWWLVFLWCIEKTIFKVDCPIHGLSCPRMPFMTPPWLSPVGVSADRQGYAWGLTVWDQDWDLRFRDPRMRCSSIHHWNQDRRFQVRDLTYANFTTSGRMSA